MGCKRDEKIDSYKGVLIYLVVFGHSITLIKGNDWIGQIYRFIYIFHMPGFIFLSGVFNKSIVNKGAVRSLIVNIISPFLVFELLYRLYHYALNGHFSPSFSKLSPYWLLWFLLCLIFWKLATIVLEQLRFPVIVSVVIALVGLSSSHTGSYLSLARVFSFLPVFIIGHIYGREIIDSLRRTPRWMMVALAIICILFAYIFAMDINLALLYGNKSLDYLAVETWRAYVLRILIWSLSLAVVVSGMVLTPKIDILANWGRNSISIYLWHGFLFLTLRKFLNIKFAKDNSELFFILFFVLSLLVVIVLSSSAFKKLTYISQRLHVVPCGRQHFAHRAAGRSGLCGRCLSLDIRR